MLNAFPEMAKTAHAHELKEELEDRREEMQGRVEHLDMIFNGQDIAVNESAARRLTEPFAKRKSVRKRSRRKTA
jgi:ferritin-like metal-binding protein YciE